MKYLAYVIAFTLALITFQIISVALGHLRGGTLDNKDYISITQVLVTFLSAIVFAFTGFATTRSNEEFKTELSSKASKDLALHQAKLSVETAESVEKIRAQMALSTNEATESLRSQFGRAGEDFKARLGQIVPQRYGAYHAMYKAASKYFFALRRLEEGSFPGDDLKAATTAADDALGSALLVDEVDRSEFYDFVREATFIAESARSEEGKPAALSEIWLKEGKQFGAKYIALGEQFAKKVQA